MTGSQTPAALQFLSHASDHANIASEVGWFCVSDESRKLLALASYEVTSTFTS